MSGILRTYRVNNSARSVDFFLDRDPDDPRFDMDQPYQRGVVWGVKRKRNLIKSLLMGIPVPAIVINDRFGAEFKHPGYSQDRNWMYAIVDGKQRVSAIQGFVRGEFAVSADWFEDGTGGAVRYSDLTLPQQRGFRNSPLPTAEGQFKTLEQERELFDLVNFGGLVQGESDDDLVHPA
ncbi:Protein of uncharacterised function DUF262 [Mycobacteroides abscessus subsp. bolletii]|uniref:DUF262 domain-containing protein n=1 Tax=Mycobacteroides abscessus TaxID=36809 RepID=UPI0009CF7E3F|nr:DUF262 domain-containing protein [Mycobacteroides abscessus]SKY97036.1 Protein of uncharacterised function DUF262 [Mycobacteroides abscessus subsp. bolletii]